MPASWWASHPRIIPAACLPAWNCSACWRRGPSRPGAAPTPRPAQLVGDFLAGRPSTQLGSVVPSYKPGVTPTDLSLCLPDFAVAAIREALPVFGRQIRGFDMHDAVMTGVETRTSSPVRITRGAGMQSLNTAGLFPAGEGAGYAGRYIVRRDRRHTGRGGAGGQPLAIGNRGHGKARCSFLKKRTKRLLAVLSRSRRRAYANGKKSFASFLQNRSPSYYATSVCITSPFIGWPQDPKAYRYADLCCRA